MFGCLWLNIRFAKNYRFGWKSAMWPFDPRLMILQAMFESGNFTSDLWKRANNCIGMRPAYQRKKWWSKVDNNYASYSSALFCAFDLVGWWYAQGEEVAKLNDGSLDAYCQILKNRSYYETSYETYLAGCQQYSGQSGVKPIFIGIYIALPTVFVGGYLVWKNRKKILLWLKNLMRHGKRRTRVGRR